MSYCPVCDAPFSQTNYSALASHFIGYAKKSDFHHISWLNRNLTKSEVSEQELTVLLEKFYHIGDGGIKEWIIQDFVRRFRGKDPHPFILAMQTYNPEILRGYVVEHHHFLRQWIRSCSYIIAKTDHEDVQSYELENIVTELHGRGPEEPSHHELLLRMGESLGLNRNIVLSTNPLKVTADGVRIWNSIAVSGGWISIMGAMHSLELIANRDLERHGAKYPYFNPDLLVDNTVPEPVKDFLREGYEADVSHSYEALDLIEKYMKQGDIQNIQYAYLKSAGAFSDYLEARIERSEMLANKQ